jgi:hypothetical protein
MTKKKVAKKETKELIPIEKSVPSEEIPLLEFKPFNKDLTVTGFVKKRSHFKNRFGNLTDMVEQFDCVKIKSSNDSNKFVKKYNLHDGESRMIKFFTPADLRDKLELCNVKGLISITYQGKDDENHHLFAVAAEYPLEPVD